MTVYCISVDGHAPIKIGRSINFKDRLDTLKSGNPLIKPEFLFEIADENTKFIWEDRATEKTIHRFLTAIGKHFKREWFDLSPVEFWDLSVKIEEWIAVRMKKEVILDWDYAEMWQPAYNKFGEGWGEKAYD